MRATKTIISMSFPLVWTVFVVRMMKLGILGYLSCAQGRFWSGCANAQADLNLRWAHMYEATLPDVAVQIICNFLCSSIYGMASCCAETINAVCSHNCVRCSAKISLFDFDYVIMQCVHRQTNFIVLLQPGCKQMPYFLLSVLKALYSSKVDIFFLSKKGKLI